MKNPDLFMIFRCNIYKFKNKPIWMLIIC